MTQISDRNAALERRIRQVNQHWTPAERQARRTLANRRFDDLVAALDGFKKPIPSLETTSEASLTVAWLEG